jgi:uncharacterized protein YktB (UPF0637 family)
MPFTSFVEKDFEVFDIESFANRMAEIKSRITPKLKELGKELAETLSSKYSTILYPHVAMHMRRSVNPPEETWIAFSCSPRAYKPFIHLRIAIQSAGIRYLCFLEDFADDKPQFASALESNADKLEKWFHSTPDLITFDIKNAEYMPANGKNISKEQIITFSKRLSNVKGQHASFGFLQGKNEVLEMTPDQFKNYALALLEDLIPLYHLVR